MGPASVTLLRCLVFASRFADVDPHWDWRLFLEIILYSICSIRVDLSKRISDSESAASNSWLLLGTFSGRLKVNFDPFAGIDSTFDVTSKLLNDHLGYCQSKTQASTIDVWGFCKLCKRTEKAYLGLLSKSLIHCLVQMWQSFPLRSLR